MLRRLIFKRKGGSLVQSVEEGKGKKEIKILKKAEAMNCKEVSLVRIEIQKR